MRLNFLNRYDSDHGDVSLSTQMLPGCPGDEPVPLRWGDRERGGAVVPVWPDKAALLQAPGAQPQARAVVDQHFEAGRPPGWQRRRRCGCGRRPPCFARPAPAGCPCRHAGHWRPGPARWRRCGSCQVRLEPLRALQRRANRPVQHDTARALTAVDARAGRGLGGITWCASSLYLEPNKVARFARPGSGRRGVDLAGELCTPARSMGQPASELAIA